MKVVELFNYPVAGMQGYKVPELEIQQEAIVGNRVFTVVRVEQIERWLQSRAEIPLLRMTQETFPKLVLFQAENFHNRLVIRFDEEMLQTAVSMELQPPTLPYWEFPPKLPEDDQFSAADIWQNFVLPIRVSKRSKSNRWGMDCGNAVANWISTRLGMQCRLFKAVQSNEEKHHFTWYTDLHLITLASLQALSGEAGEPLTEQPFRPNVVVDDGKAFSEFLWSQMAIGDVQFLVELCERCAYVNVDQGTGELSHKNVIRAITQKHQRNFGVYLKLQEGSATIKQQDEVTVTN